MALRSPSLLVAAALLLATGCGRSGERVQGEAIVRFVEGGRAETRVTVADDSRLVTGASRTALLAFAWETTVPDSGERTLTLEWPPELAAAPWVLIEPAYEAAPGRFELLPPTVLGPDRTELPSTFTVSFPGLEPGAKTRVRVAGRAMGTLADQEISSAPFLVAAGAELRFGYAVEDAAWRFDSLPVSFVVDAVGGDADPTTLFTARLDPARAEGDRSWREGRVSLDGLVGREVRLRLSVRSTDDRPGTSLPVWADPRVLAPRAAPPRPGVVLILLDTVRAASTSLGDGPHDTTPILARRVGAEGARFGQAVAPYPHTLPSHMSLFTGLYHARHRVRGFFDQLAEDHPTFPQILRAAGWTAAAFTENGFLIGGAGFQRGFSTYVENRSADLHRPTGQGPEVFRAGLDWLARHADEPFLLMLHTYQAHWPYTPAEPYRGLFEPDSSLPKNAALARLRYEQEIRHTDDLVGTVLDELDRLGLGRSTLVIVTADHGEEFGEHGQMQHGHHLYTEALHVPLAMRWPGRIPGGTEVEFPVSLVDVGPTVLELLGLPVPRDLDGRSLVPWIERRDEPAPDAAVFAEAPATVRSSQLELTGVQTAARKCIHDARDDRVECYDLARDPAERAPLGAHDDEATRAAIARLEAFRSGERSAAPAKTTRDEPLDPVLEEKLRALGYL